MAAPAHTGAPGSLKEKSALKDGSHRQASRLAREGERIQGRLFLRGVIPGGAAFQA